MIDIFYRRRESEFEFPRVRITTAPDAERAHDLIEVLAAALDPEGECASAGGRPSRDEHGSVADIIVARAQKKLIEAIPFLKVTRSR